MTEKATKKVDAFIISNFKDAGTSERFTAGKTAQIEEGAFANYARAGLVRTPTTDDRKAVSSKPAA